MKRGSECSEWSDESMQRVWKNGACIVGSKDGSKIF